jgi:hypothetical protein
MVIGDDVLAVWVSGTNELLGPDFAKEARI